MYKDCWFKGNCSRQKIKGCSSSCPNYYEFEYLINNSNIPEKMKEHTLLYPEAEDLVAFKTLASIKDNIEQFVDDGEFLYVWGHNVGSGKTSFSVKIMKTYLACKHIGNGFTDRAWFEFLPTLLLISKQFNDPQRQITIDNLMQRDLVIIDDIGSVKAGNYDISILASIIDYRYSNDKSTIFTSNLSPKELEGVLDARLADRILSGYEVQIRGSSRRGKGTIYTPKGVNQNGNITNSSIK